jgi:Protein of unknown function (DUF2971)
MEPLYHYTTANGLEGIIRTRAIWASDYRFLNDATEFNYGLSIFDRIFDPSVVPLPDVSEMIGRFRKATSEFSLLIASFCKHHDLLSQWRGYSDAAGYAVGLNAEWLQQNAEVQGFHLVPVCYDIGTQDRIIRDKIKLLKTWVEQSQSRTLFEVTKEWWAHILLSIAALKNEHFKEEVEYRLVKVTDSWPLGINARPSRRGLIPYLPFRLDAKIIEHPLFHPNNIGIERIVVGPALEDQQLAAVDALLASQHMRLEIVKSTIPFLPK